LASAASQVIPYSVIYDILKSGETLMDRYSRLEEILGFVILVDWTPVMLAVGLTVVLMLLLG
jgi:hypothetical protein